MTDELGKLRATAAAAALLHGCQYMKEVSQAQSSVFKAAGIVVVFCASDDLIEFRGAIEDEAGCYDGGTVLVYRGGVLEQFNNSWDETEAEEYFRDKAKSVPIEAVWCDETIGGSWSYKTAIPHSTFDIMEDGELYCRGIVFSISDLP